ncbi:uncharacterized protein LOC131892033 [Tigriopus californicus]|uniref:uncharacterized protein LOC131892033 n=1 Tax=Tigriopus californicus TaxID=6832 RepID=UPI0027DA1097|nr:uncharacterized protein LOC131892033 [Tigriopus californicus]
MLSLDVAQRHGLRLDATSDTVRAANGDQMSVAGRIVLELTVNSRTAYVDCLVSSCMRNSMLISWHDLQNLGVIGSAFPLAASGEINTAVEGSSAIEEMTQDLRRQFHDVLSDSLAPDQRVVGDPIQIRLTEDAVPYHANTSCPILLHYCAEADATIKRLLDSGRISRVEEATTWCARAHFVPKEGGKAGLCLVTDYRVINKFINSFCQAKKLLTSSLLVKQFDEKLETFLLLDASRLHGLGFMLMQKEKNGHPRIVQCGSFSLTPAQRNYAAIELECLAILHAVHKCDSYLRGCAFTVMTDHKPLVGIFAKDIIDIHNVRLAKFRKALSSFSFQIKWTPGKDNLIADALSRTPLFPCEPDHADCMLQVVSQEIDHLDPKLAFILSSIDEGYKKLIQEVRSHASARDLPPTSSALSFKSSWSDLSILPVEGAELLLCDGKIVPPMSARPEILRRLHLSHQGLEKTKLHAKLFAWPGMASDTKGMIDACTQCQTYRPSKPVEGRRSELSTSPMTRVGLDPADTFPADIGSSWSMKLLVSSGPNLWHNYTPNPLFNPSQNGLTFSATPFSSHQITAHNFDRSLQPGAYIKASPSSQPARIIPIQMA